ncbi:vWA domain-containing protein [Luteipulveratus mongoliensis]|uniref:von Willebrand factor A n=1 Tax=Luteipulveratus mongoliensis TaxID=571913 RepID=A0A0K1JDM9_9MICO|nr:vWA domain-containing protein [Luteipulveratus mongoliensis]AKU14811.1 von Willebrand factor A [Luteipulveratus mongoliensis]
MTRSDLTHIYFLLDRSGSMQTIKSDTEGGFNAFIEEQRKADGDCRVTLAQFDDEYDVVYTDKPVADVPPLALQPRRSTALLDAMGRLITESGTTLAGLPEDQRPATIIVAIMTDGLENASREWTRPAIKSLVEQQTRDYEWQFLYMGADQDAIEVGAGLGVAREHSMSYSRGAVKEAMTATSGNIARYRGARAGGAAAKMEGYTDEQRREAEGS